MRNIWNGGSACRAVAMLSALIGGRHLGTEIQRSRWRDRACGAVGRLGGVRIMLKNWATGSAIPTPHDLKSSTHFRRRLHSDACHPAFQDPLKPVPTVQTHSWV